MYVKEQHIDVQQAMQKIGANKTRKLYDAEIDWILNKMQNRFIRDRIRPRIDPTTGRHAGGFELVQDDADAIKTLLRTGVFLPASQVDSRRVVTILPGDYAYLIQDESVIKRLPLGTPQPLATSSTVYLLLLPIIPSALTAPPYYKQVQVIVNGALVIDFNTIARNNSLPSWVGYNSVDQAFALHNPILLGLKAQGWDAYFEYYGNLFLANHTILIASSAPLTGSIVIDGVSTTGVTTGFTTRPMDIPTVRAEYQANRLTPSNLVSSLLEVAFYGTQPEFPISEIADRSLYVYYNKGFIVSGTTITYLRKPRRISLILGTDCELSPEYHSMICDLAVEYIKGAISDPNWQMKLEDNMKRTTLDQ